MTAAEVLAVKRKAPAMIEIICYCAIPFAAAIQCAWEGLRDGIM